MYVLKIIDLSARQKAIILKRKGKTMKGLLEGAKEFVKEKNGEMEVKENV